MRKNGIYIRCAICSKRFYISKSRIGKKKLCSLKCSGAYRRSELLGNTYAKGHIAWNKGYSKSGFGLYSQNRIELRGKKHPSWNGNKVDYSTLHQWVRRYLGKPDTCEHCNTSDLSGRQIHWANKSGSYKRRLDDWIRLCAPCHKKFDQENNFEVPFVKNDNGHYAERAT